MAFEGSRKELEKMLYDSYPIVFGYLMTQCREEELAKDLTQEVMVKAIVNINQFRGDSKFSTWLVAIAANVLRDAMRRKKAIPVAPETMAGLQAAEVTASAEQQAEKREEQSALMASIEALPEPQKQVFVLKHFYGLSYEAIAELAKCPIGTVRSRLHNGIKRLRETMEKEG